jgi:glycosyltransferase involved in cell wall biosynthesis
MPAISVIMLTYNRETLVSRAIESILAQTFADFEFIIIDNGSCDRSGEIADEYAAKDSRIKVIHRDRGNIGSGRNAGLDAAKGKYIAFIDDDDYAEPDFLEFLFNLAVSNNADISICGSWRKSENGEIEPKYIFDELLLYNTEAAVTEIILRKHYNSATPTKLFRKQIFDELRFPIQGKYDDIAMTYKLFANSRLTAAHGKGKYYFSRHEGNNSGAATKHQFLDPLQLTEYLSVFRERTEYISRVLPNLSGLAQWSEWSYMISMVEKINRYHLTNCGEPLTFMLQELKLNRETFLRSPWTQEFEKQWMGSYVLV